MSKRKKKADQIMASYVREFLGCFDKHKELVETLLELKENGCKEESWFVCTPFMVHAVPDEESPSFFIQKGFPDGRETVAELFWTGSEWETWCSEWEPFLAWRIANIAFLWNHYGNEEA